MVVDAQKMTAELPHGWKGVARSSASTIASIVTLILYLGRAPTVDEGVVIALITSLHASVWQLVAGIWRVRKLAARLVWAVTAVGLLSGAVTPGCGSLQLRDDLTACSVAAGAAAATVAAAVERRATPEIITSLVAAAIVSVTQACLEKSEVIP